MLTLTATAGDSMKRIGILFGMENTFPPALVARINEISAKVRAESVRVGTTDMEVPSGYDLIIDRISHDIPYYRAYLKNAVLHGAIVINNPFWWSADDKFFNYALASQLGVAVPKTVLIPSNQHPPDTTSMSMRNLIYPLDWNEVFRTVGFPAFLKPHSGGGWKHVYKVNNEPEFFEAYHRTGDLVMTLQEGIEFDDYVRCYCIGRENVHIMRYDPRRPHEGRYVRDAPPLNPALERRITNDCLTLNRALGYDLNTVEFAIRGGVPYAIDFLNPAPDADINSVGPDNFAWVVNAVAEMAVKQVTGGGGAPREYRWEEFLGGGDLVRPPAAKKAPPRRAKKK
jgi:glutathione synthase/RimK-type ligase-like ATP-grasp enzyme